MSTDVRSALRAWVADRNPGLDPGTLTDQTPLISTRLVTSLHVVELLLLIEELRAAPVDPRSLAPGAFRARRSSSRVAISGPCTIRPG